MKRRLAEETVLFASILKWVALARITGTVVGASTAILLKILQWSSSLADKYPWPEEFG